MYPYMLGPDVFY